VVAVGDEQPAHGQAGQHASASPPRLAGIGQDPLRRRNVMLRQVIVADAV
jgi:hypothetical protein